MYAYMRQDMAATSAAAAELRAHTWDVGYVLGWDSSVSAVGFVVVFRSGR